MNLWTSTAGSCDFLAGVMPGLSLAGQIFLVPMPMPTPGVCGYSDTVINGIISDAGLENGDYLSIMCGSWTLPTDLEAVCIPGASWEAVIVASTTSSLASECPAACATGCAAATAEGVE
jgi:hypothetical protein